MISFQEFNFLIERVTQFDECRELFGHISDSDFRVGIRASVARRKLEPVALQEACKVCEAGNARQNFCGADSFSCTEGHDAVVIAHFAISIQEPFWAEFFWFVPYCWIVVNVVDVDSTHGSFGDEAAVDCRVTVVGADGDRDE